MAKPLVVKRNRSKQQVVATEAALAAKVKLAKKQQASFPKDWPVRTSPPNTNNAVNASAIAPGSLLLQQCTGTDIQLARASQDEPNLAKEKGRYLIILPGILSFKAAQAAQQRTTTATATAAAAALLLDNNNNNNKAGSAKDDNGEEIINETNKDSGDDDDDDENDTKPPAKSTTTAGATAAKTTTNSTTTTTETQLPLPVSLGRLQGMATDTPVLRVPFPNIGKTLVFQGKKVQTSSKFMMLTCDSRRQGSVTCKVRRYVVLPVHV
jgi:hypothetical protein